MKALGRLFDLQSVIMPVDLAGGANGGALVSLENASGVTFVFIKNQGIAGDDPVLTFREAQDGAATGEQDLDVVTEYFSKTNDDASALDGTETWSRFTQSAGDIDGANDAAEVGLSGEDEALVAVYIDADDLSDGFTHVTVDIADTGAGGACIGAVLAIVHDLAVQRAPQNLAATK
jgi:hypothetical protein